MADIERAKQLIQKHLDAVASDSDLAELERSLAESPAVGDAFAAATRLDSLLHLHFQRERYSTDLGALLGMPPGFGAGKRDPGDEGPQPKSHLLIRRTAAITDSEGERVVPLPVGRFWHALRRTPIRAAAAMLVLAIGIGLVTSSLRKVPRHTVVSGHVMLNGIEAKQIADGARVRIVGAVPAVIRLSDGSRAEFAPRSEATLRGRVGNVRQVVELVRGRGRFEVEKRANQFRVETQFGTITALGTEFTVELQPADQGEQEMQLRKIVALAVVVASGVVQVDVGDVSQRIMPGESRVFAGEKKQRYSLPSGDVVGFARNGEPSELEKGYHGIVHALLLTDVQKQAIRQARDETVASEAVLAALKKIKTDLNATDAEKQAALSAYENARTQLAERVGAILTPEQNAVVEKINTAIAEVEKAAREALQAQFSAAQGDKGRTDEVGRQFDEKTRADLSAKLAGLLTPEQYAAYQKGAANWKAELDAQ